VRRSVAGKKVLIYWRILYNNPSYVGCWIFHWVGVALKAPAPRQHQKN
jgi:hypothetical protein